MRVVGRYVGLSLTALACLLPIPAHAVGEIFRVETSGTEYCGDFDSGKFNARNSIPLWARIDSDTQLTMSFSQSFAPGTTFPLFGNTYLTKANSAAFIGGMAFDDGSYITMQGSAKIDTKSGLVTQLRGTFIQSGVVYLECFSAGSFATARQ